MGRIFFIGYMGVGKSSTAKAFAEYAGLSWVDLDEVIEKSSGERIQSIFERRGEEYFRKLESATLEKILKDSTLSVIACGGGTTRHIETQSQISIAGYVVHLNTPFPILVSRLLNDANRPLLSREGSFLTEHEILLHWRDRQSSYAFANEEITTPVSVSDFQRWEQLLSETSP